MNMPEPAMVIVGCPKVDREQIPLLTELGLQAFGEAGPVRYGRSRGDFYRGFYALNPSICRFVVIDEHRPVTESNLAGLLSVIPTRKGTFERFIAGKVSQFEFGSDEILPEYSTEPCDLYLQALYLHPQRYRMMRRLLAGLMHVLMQLSCGRIDGSTPGSCVCIYGEAVSSAGQQIMKAFDMQIEGRSKDDNPVYVIRTTYGNPLTIRTRYSLLNAQMQAIITPGL